MVKQTKLFAVPLALLLSASLLAGCGSKEEATPEAPAPEPAPVEEPATPEPEEPEEPAITEASYVGDWTAVGFESDGVKMTGDLSLFGISFTMTISDNGTFTMSMDDNSFVGKWRLQGEQAILSPEDEDIDKITLSLDEEGRASFTNIDVDDDDGEDMKMGVTFTRTDGGAPLLEYDMAQAKAITDASDLVGTWDDTGVYMMGVSVTGDISQITQIDNYTLTFNEDGTGVADIDGTTQDFTWTIGDDGASVDFGGVDCAISLLGDDLTFDMSTLAGQDDSYYIFSKV